MKKYKVYRITNSSNGKKYIGLTRRATLQDRLNAHFNELSRKANQGQFINQNSLQAAMYEAYQKDELSWRNIFHIELIKDFDSEQEMRDCESKFIKDENTLAPHGYNLVQGGHSIGGIGRNQAVSIEIFDCIGGRKSWDFPSKKEMYSKLGEEYSIKPSTLRWRVKKYIEQYQSKDILTEEILLNAICHAIFDFSDKRKTGGTNSIRQKNRRRNQNLSLGVESSFSNQIKYPNIKNEFILNSSDFAKLHNISKSSVRARSMRFLEKNGFQYKNAEGLNEYIQSRRDFINFVLSDHSQKTKIKFTHENKEYSGSLTSLAKQFEISVSTVKKRYRSLDQNLQSRNEYLLWVFGLANKPEDVKKIILPKTFTQKKKINDYELSNMVRFSRQVDFVRAVGKVLDNENVKYSSLQKIISYYIPKDNTISDAEKIDCLISQLEKRFKVDNLVEKITMIIDSN